MAEKTPLNPLRPSAKLSQNDVALAVDLFGQGIGVNIAAKAVGVSRKTMRGLYIEFRDRLPGPSFTRWHRANVVAPSLVSADRQITAKAAFFDLLTACHDQEHCHRNFAAGRRKNTQCRSCPLLGHFSLPETSDEAVALARMVRTTYVTLNIGAEHGEDRVSLFRRRLIHMVVIATVLQSSRQLQNGSLDPKQTDFLSYGTFRRVFVTELLQRPLGTGSAA